jgi:hypothetical protein
MLNITFTPNGSNTYAFINGIEILSMPTNLYYTPSGDDEGFSFIGQGQGMLYRIENSTALEMLYRLNVGGRTMSISEDTGMFRLWSQDDNYFTSYDERDLPFNNTIKLKFTQGTSVHCTRRSLSDCADYGGEQNSQQELQSHLGIPCRLWV